MKVRFWGTRGSIAKAGPTTVRYGGNTSCVEVRTASGEVLVLDCGTGAHGLGVTLAREGPTGRRGHVLISHTHWDHIQGLPFFAPLFIPGNEWDVYGPRGLGRSLAEVLSGQMEYTYFPITAAHFQARVGYHDLVEGAFEIGDVRVTTRYLNHPALTLAYKIEADGVTVVYATDHEPHDRRLACGGAAPQGSDDERHGQFLADADLVIHDTQYTAEEYPARRGWGHSTMEYVVDLARAGSVRRLAMFHHDPLRDDAGLDALVTRAQQRVHDAGDRVDVFAAAEGNLVEVPRPPRRRSSAGAADSALADAPAERRHSVVIAAEDRGLSGLLEEAAVADGIVPVFAQDLEAALTVLRGSTPSLVLVDAGLPGAGDEPICGALRARLGEEVALPPVVLITAEGVSPCPDAGADEQLERPFSAIYARTRIRAWCLREACRWRSAPRPDDEDARLAALRSLSLRQGEAEERFDRLTRIAARLFRVPFVLVNVIDDEWQWTKSAAGVDLPPPLPRDVSLCAHTILCPDVLQIVDLNRSEFADDLAFQANGIRFYAGVAVAAPGGARIGTLCLMDARPREFEEEELELLRDVARLVEEELTTGE